VTSPLVRNLVNKPLTAAGISEYNARDWKNVVRWEFHSCYRTFASRPTVHFSDNLSASGIILWYTSRRTYHIAAVLKITKQEGKNETRLRGTEKIRRSVSWKGDGALERLNEELKVLQYATLRNAAAVHAPADLVKWRKWEHQKLQLYSSWIWIDRHCWLKHSTSATDGFIMFGTFRPLVSSSISVLTDRSLLPKHEEINHSCHISRSAYVVWHPKWH